MVGTFPKMVAELLMRKINLLIVHCSASDNPKDSTVERVRLLHTGNKKTKIDWGIYTGINCFGWSDVGYQHIITPDGTVHDCRPENKPGAHCKGFNKSSIGICLIGDKVFTEAQFAALRILVKKLISKHELSIMDILGHRELNRDKSCPNFDVHEKLGFKDGKFI
jgi:hypothetical protein